LISRLRGALLPIEDPKAAAALRDKSFAQGKPAAVLIPIFRREDRYQVLYTRRSDDMQSHQGQVAFPGGRFDSSDRNLMETALREAHEEVGIVPDDVEVIGRLPVFGTRVSGYSVTPFVGTIPDAIDLRPDPAEVAEIFSVPFEVLSDPRFRGRYQFKRGGGSANFPAILYGGQVIWGLTLRITENLLELLSNHKKKSRS